MNSNNIALSLCDKTDKEFIFKLHSINPDVRALIERYIKGLLESDKY